MSDCRAHAIDNNWHRCFAIIHQRVFVDWWTQQLWEIPQLETIRDKMKECLVEVETFITADENGDDDMDDDSEHMSMHDD